jgi:leucyl/phenylalanyl-tRNA--protein transferase
MLPPARFFPPVEQSTPEGLLALGGRLSPEWLLDAYSHGIFPWPFSDGGPMAWWSPDPRAVIELDGLHVSRRLRRTIRSGKFRVTCDRDFPGVIEGCASENGRQEATWITPEILAAYVRLHQLGYAHSVEVWRQEQLAGGTYGVSIGGLFAAESKFYRVRDASKVALVYLVAHLRARGYRLLDIQQLTAHTARLGATTIRRSQYLRRLAQCLPLEVAFGDHLEGDPVLGLG